MNITVFPIRTQLQQGHQASVYNSSIQETEISQKAVVHSSPSLPTLTSSCHPENGQDTFSEVLLVTLHSCQVASEIPLQESYRTKQMKPRPNKETHITEQ